MAQQVSRERPDTRNLILDAATEVLIEQGMSASLDKIAARAELSKGGVTYHFATKEALLTALATRILEDFTRDVEGELTSDDEAPGRLARAYVRASAKSQASASAARDRWTLLPMLVTVGKIGHGLQQDSLRWHHAMAADGLSTELLDLVITSADGISMSSMWAGTYTSERIRALSETLIALTHGQGKETA